MAAASIVRRVAGRALQPGLALRQLSNLSSDKLIDEYQPPSWAAGLGGVRPTHRLNIARLLDAPSLAGYQTPIQRWNVPRHLTTCDAEYWIKRDDMSCPDPTLAGNKLRKLAFLVADALVREDADCLLTVGAVQSNHVRATAALGQKLGLKVFACVRGELNDQQALPLSGNVLPDLLAGTELFPIPSATFAQIGSDEALTQLKEHVVASTPFRRPYVVPLGGSNDLGAWGYIAAIDELIQQHSSTSLPFEHIVCTTGSGGTLAGLTIGAAAAKLKSDRTGAQIRVHGFAVCNNQSFFVEHVEERIRSIWPTGPSSSRDLVTINDSTRGLGYGKSTDAELELLGSLATSTGVILDPVYTLKSAKGMLSTDFGRDRVLFIHTGGMLGLYDAGKLQQLACSLLRVNTLSWKLTSS